MNREYRRYLVNRYGTPEEKKRFKKAEEVIDKWGILILIPFCIWGYIKGIAFGFMLGEESRREHQHERKWYSSGPRRRR